MKNAILISVLCILLGAAIAFSGMAMLGFDFAKLLTNKYQTETVYIDDPFDAVAIDTAEHDIRFAFSEDDRCKLVYTAAQNLYCRTEVKDGTLHVMRTDARKWYMRIGFFYGDLDLTIYLPKSMYGEFYAKTLSGNIEIPDGFLVNRVTLKTTSGDVTFASSAEDLSAESTSGNVTINGGGVNKDARVYAKSTSGDVSVKGTSGWRLECITVSGDICAELWGGQELHADTTSGNIEIRDTSSDTLTVKTTSGDVLLSDVQTSKSTTANTASGDIRLERADLADVRFKTVSGDIRGSLTKAMLFESQTVSGTVRFPAADIAGGHFKTITTSGNVHITIAE